MTALILVGAVLAGCVRWRIRLKRGNTNSGSHRLVSMVHAAVVTSSDAAPVSAGVRATHRCEVVEPGIGGFGHGVYPDN